MEYLTVNIKELAFDVELPDDECTWERKIEMLKIANEITHMIFGPDLMYHHSEVFYNWKHIVTYQVALGRTDSALDSLEKMAQHALAYDLSYENDIGKHFLSPFVDTIVYNEENPEFSTDTEHNLCWQGLRLLTDGRFDNLRDNKKFRAIIKTLESTAK